MQIVIDIDDEIVIDAKDFPNLCLYCHSDKIWKAISKGVRLPKGHGRLIDARDYENSIRKHYFDSSTVIRCTEIALGNARTIIEADKENKDGDSD